MTSKNNKATNWDAYYEKPAPTASITRKISEKKLINLIDNNLRENTESKIAEFGGANSCFIDAILNAINPKQYSAFDNNEFGLNLLSKKFIHSDVVTTTLQDVLKLEGTDEEFDLVFSVGLIEHLTKQWDFPDERPLSFHEVKQGMEPHCEIIHESINWLIGLTQGYLVGIKR